MLSFFPLDVLDEIWDLIESVSEGFLSDSSDILLLIDDKMATKLFSPQNKTSSGVHDAEKYCSVNPM